MTKHWKNFLTAAELSEVEDIERRRYEANKTSARLSRYIRAYTCRGCRRRRTKEASMVPAYHMEGSSP